MSPFVAVLSVLKMMNNVELWGKAKTSQQCSSFNFVYLHSTIFICVWLDFDYGSTPIQGYLSFVSAACTEKMVALYGTFRRGAASVMHLLAETVEVTHN